MSKRQPNHPVPMPVEEICRVTRQNEKDEAAAVRREKLHRAVKEAKLKPVQAARAVRDRLAASKADYELLLYTQLALAYAAAQALIGHRLHWGTFVNDSFWADYDGHKPKRDQPSDHLRWMMIFVLQAKDEKARDRANTYRGALADLFEQRASPETVVEHLQRSGGIEVLYRENLPGARQARGEVVPASESGTTKAKLAVTQSNSDASLVADSGGMGDSLPPPEEAPAAKKPSLAQRAKAIKDKGLKPVLVGLKPNHWKEATGRFLQRGAASLDVDLEGDVEDWIDFTCRSVRPLKA